jgi:hypothetical protein
MYISSWYMYMMKHWTIATARQRLPELIKSAAREPQRVYRRDKLVAAVVSPELAQQIAKRPTVAEAFAELQRICAEESYELPVVPRTTRPNPFAPNARTRKRKR